MADDDEKKRNRAKKTKADRAKEAKRSREYRARKRAEGVPTIIQIDAALAHAVVTRMHDPRGLHLSAGNRRPLVDAILRFAERDPGNKKAREAVEHRINALHAKPAPEGPPAASFPAGDGPQQTDD